MKERQLSCRAAIYRATGIAFLFQLFGALGAGLIFVVGNIFGSPAYSSEIWRTLWHIFFWSTDFFFVGFAAVLCYLIAGLPGIAPALTLSLYFSHFSALYEGGTLQIPMYNNFYTTPAGGAGGTNIGYMGFLIMALLIAYLIRWLYPLWDKIKIWLGTKLRKLANQLMKNDDEAAGETIVEAADLIILILILPIVSCIITYFVIQYGVAAPFQWIANQLGEVLRNAFAQSTALGGLLMGAMVGFDIIGPVSMSAFSVAGEFAAAGAAVPMTVYGLCFATIGWIPLGFYLLNKVTKKGGKVDTDDMNIAASGPINALFDNMKLTVNFSMSFAFRSPFTTIPAYIVSGAIAGVLGAAAGLANSTYLSDEMVALFLSGERYMSFQQPQYSMGSTSKGFLLLIFLLIAVFLGAALMLVLREWAHRWRAKHGQAEIPSGDIVLEMRNLAKRRNRRSVPAAKIPENVRDQH